jgi:uncharacterized protein YbbK (DUF523 family)
VLTFYCEDTLTFPPSVAVSACLLGQAVRYDGGHQAHALLQELIVPQVEILPRCPEAILGIPRPPVNLVMTSTGVRARGRDQYDLDVTAALTQFAHHEVQSMLQRPNLCGHIFKSRSPSCGLSSTPIYSAEDQLPENQLIKTGSGLYAAIIAEHLPWLVLAEETQLNSPAACADFLQKLFLVRDLQRAAAQQQLLSAHRHYDFLWRHCTTIDDLAIYAKNNNWHGYCAELLKKL